MIIKFIKFTLVAGGSTCSDWCTFTALHYLGTPPFLSLVSGRLVGGVFSFILNRNWSFNSQQADSLSLQGKRFVILYALSFMLAMGMYGLLYNHLNFGPFVSKIITDFICFIFNFIVSHFYVYGLHEWRERFARRKV